MPHCMLVSRKAPDKLTTLTTPLCEFRTFKTSTCMYGNLLNIPRNMGGVWIENFYDVLRTKKGVQVKKPIDNLVVVIGPQVASVVHSNY